MDDGAASLAAARRDEEVLLAILLTKADFTETNEVLLKLVNFVTVSVSLPIGESLFAGLELRDDVLDAAQFDDIADFYFKIEWYREGSLFDFRLYFLGYEQ